MESTASHKRISFSAAPTSSGVVIARVSATDPSRYSPARPVVRRRRARGSVTNDIENAVYSYIQAIRTLGRTQVNITEIAQALALPTEAVTLAASKLRHKGVLPGK